MAYRNTFYLLLIVIFFCCESKKNSKNIKSSESVDTIATTISTELQDTMVLKGIEGLKKTPDSQGEDKKILENCTLLILEKKLVPNMTFLGRGETYDSFVKVSTLSGDTGYVMAAFLITLSHYRAFNDSLAMWDSLQLPSYKELIGTSYYVNSELPKELSPGAFFFIGGGTRYGVVLVSNKYTDRFSYLFFVENTGRYRNGRDNELKILDIIALEWEKYGKDVQPWFQHCECIDTTQRCSDIVAVYKHTSEMAREGIMVTPERAWRPDTVKQCFVEIDVSTVRCGSLAPEEVEDIEGP